MLQRLREGDPRWRLEVCGDRPLATGLAERLRALGVADAAVLRGYVPIDGGLWDRYLGSHLLLHVSHTEGLPQVLLEAFAARLPVVATAVGGVPEVVRGAGLLIGPDDADAAVEALQRIVAEPELREQLIDRATAEVRDHTLEAECARLAAFIAGATDEHLGGGAVQGRGRPRDRASTLGGGGCCANQRSVPLPCATCIVASTIGTSSASVPGSSRSAAHPAHPSAAA